MKLYMLFFLLSILLCISACQNKQTSSEHHHDSTSTHQVVTADTIKKSIPKEEHAQIGNAHLMIKYHAPAVRGRTIWGGLVPYGEVWVTGGHSATSFEIDKNFIVNSQEIPAGKYAIFTIPGKEKWIIIFNKNWEQHLADEYDTKGDVIRVETIPQLRDTLQERLQYHIISNGDTKGALNIRWEKIEVTLPFEIR